MFPLSYERISLLKLTHGDKFALPIQETRFKASEGRSQAVNGKVEEMDMSGLTPPELLVLHAKVADEFRERGVTRSSNNPTGDLAEYLFCRAFGWDRAGNSKASIDAVGADGLPR